VHLLVCYLKCIIFKFIFNELSLILLFSLPLNVTLLSLSQEFFILSYWPTSRKCMDTDFTTEVIDLIFLFFTIWELIYFETSYTWVRFSRPASFEARYFASQIKLEIVGETVFHLAGALCYKPEGCGYHHWWYHPSIPSMALGSTQPLIISEW